jgi:hypothetical protein
MHRVSRTAKTSGVAASFLWFWVWVLEFVTVTAAKQQQVPYFLINFVKTKSNNNM